MKLFELYFSDLTPAAQREWADTFGEKPMEFTPIHSFEVDDDDDESVDENSMKVDGNAGFECTGCSEAAREEFDVWL